MELVLPQARRARLSIFQKVRHRIEIMLTIRTEPLLPDRCCIRRFRATWQLCYRPVSSLVFTPRALGVVARATTLVVFEQVVLDISRDEGSDIIRNE